MALTIDDIKFNTAGSLRGASFDMDFDSSYPTGGESFPLGSIGFSSEITSFEAEGKDGFRFEYDEANNKVLAFSKPFPETTVTVTHAAGAAAAGVALYVHIDEVSEQGSDNAHLEFISPTTTDGTCLAYAGGPTVYFQHDAAANTGGALLYFDEDATIGSRFLANTGRDCYVDIGSGRAIKVTHHATPATPGVQVYFDEDAATASARLLFVSPTTTSGSDTTTPEVTDGTDLSALVDVRCVVQGL